MPVLLAQGGCAYASPRSCPLNPAVRNVNFRTGTDAVVPNRSDVLKQNYLQGFKTRRLSFDY
ncbi:hypothetical protein FUT82_04655 [Treponema phagedenis]|uniref:Uncharacterized protein n=1 Tax=Treponema phagedenis TaxID=162 RepID=A0AAE6M8B3_TREPH|nr:hypothetical protein FUT82_04655 [Treponema phagedenis]